MTAWLRRNTVPVITVPVLIVLGASALVVAGLEILDALAASEPLDGADGEAALTIGGLIKVTLFLAVPAAITLAIRGRAKTP